MTDKAMELAREIKIMYDLDDEWSGNHIANIIRPHLAPEWIPNTPENQRQLVHKCEYLIGHSRYEWVGIGLWYADGGPDGMGCWCDDGGGAMATEPSHFATKPLPPVTHPEQTLEDTP